MSESQEKRLQRLLEKSRDLNLDLERRLGRNRILEQEQETLRDSLAQIESGFRHARVAGLQMGTVDAGGRDGEPAAQDDQGRVPVKVDWDGRQHTLMARVAAPWNHQGGGVSFIPRNGEAVYLGFENGRPELPVIMGYHPVSGNSLAYNPVAGSYQSVLAATADASGNAYNPPTGNQYKSVISTKSQGADGKSSEIAFGDHPGKESLTTSTQGEMRHFSQGDHHLNVGGNSVSTHMGDLNRRVMADSKKTVAKDMERKVGQDLESQITGDKNETVQGNYHFEVPGQFKQQAIHGKSVYYIWQGKSEGLYLGGKNCIMVGEDIGIYMCALVRQFLANFDNYLGLRTFVTGQKDAWAVMYFDNEVVRLRTRLAKIKRTSARAQELLAVMDVDTMQMDDKQCSMADFACKLSTGEGLKINL